MNAIRRCCACGRLLCVQVGPSFQIKYRETRFVVDGRVQVTCGRCRRSTILSVSHDSQEAP